MKFRSVRAVTWAVPDVETSAAAFEQALGCRRVSAGEVAGSLAEFWEAPAAAGRHCVVLQPDSGARVFMRFVESTAVAGYAPLMTYGWNAAELHVQDVRGLARSLENSAFSIIGPPRDLLGNDSVVAMQVLGPGQELLYLTQISHPGMQATYGSASSPVDRVFIAVLGVSDQQNSMAFYAPYAVRQTQRKQFKITVLANAHGLDPEQARFDIASVVMAEQYRIETDAYPASACERPVREGHLPPGMAMVSVGVDRLPRGLRSEVPAGWPYHGGRVGMLRGPDGEWLECLEDTY